MYQSPPGVVGLKMYHYCQKYGVKPYKLYRHLSKFETVDIPGYRKPWIIDNESNYAIVSSLIGQSTTTRPRLPRITIQSFADKYEVAIESIEKHLHRLNREEVDGITLIADSAHNRRFFGI
jgi:hypothetical protein